MSPGEFQASVSHVRLVAPLVPSGSGTAAFLGIASDAEKYWVKAPNNPQGARCLITERVVYGIGDLIGAPVPRSALVEIPASFRWEFGPGLRLRGGIGHGSRNLEPVIEHDGWGRFSDHDHNRERQALIAALWDLCLGEDPQWLHHLSDDMSIFTFDHGLWFGGGADWTLDALRTVGTAPWNDLDVGTTSSEALVHAADKLAALSLADLRAVAGTVPLEWNTTPDELSELAALLFARTRGVAERLRSASTHVRRS